MNNHVSIIVVHYSQRDDFLPETDIRSRLVKKCIDSIAECTNYPAELIVIDNGGKKDDSSYLVSMLRTGKINTYVRNKDNMHFAYAWNQGVKLATGNYVLLTCNDYVFKPNWLEKTIYPLLKYPEKKLIGCPFLAHNRHNTGKLEDYRLDFWGLPGANLMTKETFYDIGEYPITLLASPPWIKRATDLGYQFIAPPINYGERLGVKCGLNPKKIIKVEKELLNKQKIDFTWKK